MDRSAAAAAAELNVPVGMFVTPPAQAADQFVSQVTRINKCTRVERYVLCFSPLAGYRGVKCLEWSIPLTRLRVKRARLGWPIGKRGIFETYCLGCISAVFPGNDAWKSESTLATFTATFAA